nr:immunoglobulin light chain junction region [Macaca mulatta]MOW02189.1 immunoglobulin light chain junction region [Macaca mulatta]MOW02213.1 immunoglobulin light chain junction region [Macaca mulatta]MOW02222.1 immunoglobulin light chain junction region [Macaca mulatta]MOW02470.1 immunoglobulin light chain junction region [Macaca mulatta]
DYYCQSYDTNGYPVF